MIIVFHYFAILSLVLLVAASGLVVYQASAVGFSTIDGTSGHRFRWVMGLVLLAICLFAIGFVSELAAWGFQLH